MKNKNHLFLLLMVLIVLGIISIYFINVSKQYTLPFFDTTLSRFFYAVILLIGLILSLFITDYWFGSRFSSKPKFHHQAHQQRIRRLLHGFTACAFFALIFYIFYLTTNSAIQGIYIKTNEFIGKQVIKEFGIKQEITKNPTYKQKINIGTAQRTHYIIDPSPYLVHITLYDNQHEYRLDTYCATGDLAPKLKQPIIRIAGFYSALGFHCEKQNCHLSDYFENSSHTGLQPEQFSSCKNIQKHSPEAL